MVLAEEVFMPFTLCTCCDWHLLERPLAAVCLPVVGAVVVCGSRECSRRVEEESVLARLVAQAPVGALEETVAGGGVFVHLENIRSLW